ncbi:MAG: rRNA maturation RNase YbeY [Patescibacteria group bacterium]|nr:rRNA maturation RNase YbeY [Patescibacteria group bacterium]
MISLGITNFTKQSAPLKTMEAVAIFVAKKLKLTGELSVVLAGDRRLHSLNREFRGYDKVTDVLTFSAPEEMKNALGEIFINLNDCHRGYKYNEVFSEKKSFKYILIFLLIHGLLHLAGDDDKSEKERLQMVARGEKIMQELFKNDIIKANL